MAINLKSGKILERYFKGVANHRRIEILILVAKKEGIALEQIAEILDCNIKTISEHTRKLVQSGLVNKRYKGTSVLHSVSPYGKYFVDFFKKF